LAATNHGCDQVGCQGYFSYIRFKKKWIKIGVFHSKCKSFILFDDVKLEDSKLKNSNYDPTDNYLKLLTKAESDYFKLISKS